MEKVPEQSGIEYLGKSFECRTRRELVCPTTCLWTCTISHLDPSTLWASSWLSWCPKRGEPLVPGHAQSLPWRWGLMGLWGQASTSGALLKCIELGPYDLSGAFPKHRAKTCQEKPFRGLLLVVFLCFFMHWTLAQHSLRWREHQSFTHYSWLLPAQF